MRRSAFKSKTGGFTIPRGKWVRVIRGMKTPNSGYLLMTGQMLIRVPADVTTVETRFVRVYANGKRDGTGDIDHYVGHRAGKAFQTTFSHPIKSGAFKVDVEIRVPGNGECEMRYAYGKIHY